MEPHEANRAFWDASTAWWKEKEDARGLWRRAHEDPTMVLNPLEMPFVRDVDGRNVCVLGSGDNEVAFALVGLGGRVTSVDISERRLEVAAERARELDLSLAFLQADVTDLSVLGDETFDLVYTGGHMSVWVSDIKKYYGEAVRALRPRGLLIVNDYHPIRRMWHESDGPTPRHPYFNRGSYEYRTGEGNRQVEFHWTVADHIQAVLDAGCALVAVDEHGAGKEEDDYAAKVPATLPMYLLIVGRKRPPHNRAGSPR